MFVYSKKIMQFINEIKTTIRYTLSYEVGLNVTNTRFYDKLQVATYPIRVVIYNNKSMLGYFDANFYELGFHECLMHCSREQLHDIIRHELAHYLTFIKHGETEVPHGAEFRATCQALGWGESVSKATTCLDDGRVAAHSEENSVLRKVQKLMALAGSSNQYEAEQAMVKSQQMLLKHNMEANYIGIEDEEKMCLKRIMKQKKENAKMRAIAKILETFFVNIVYSRAGGFTYLEILGSAVNVEIAEYVADVLHHEFEKLWKQAQRNASYLKGMVAKNSFFLGIAKGYCNKIQALKKEYSSEVSNALMVLEKKLVDAKAMAYQRLSSGKSNASYCSMSSMIGEQMGRQLNINPAIKNSSTNSGALLQWKEHA